MLGISRNRTALNIVAAIGSTTLNAEAIPAGRCFIDQVNRKKGITNVNTARQIQRGTVGIGADTTLFMRFAGLQIDNAIMLINIKLYKVTVIALSFFCIETLVRMLYAA